MSNLVTDDSHYRDNTLLVLLRFRHAHSRLLLTQCLNTSQNGCEKPPLSLDADGAANQLRCAKVPLISLLVFRLTSHL